MLQTELARLRTRLAHMQGESASDTAWMPVCLSIYLCVCVCVRVYARTHTCMYASGEKASELERLERQHAVTLARNDLNHKQALDDIKQRHHEQGRVNRLLQLQRSGKRALSTPDGAEAREALGFGFGANASEEE